MRYRNKSKIKTKHHLIDELDKFLAKIEKWPEVMAINPGVITNCRHNDRLKFEVQYKSPSGIKCLAKSHGAVQEVFIVSDKTDELIKKLENNYI